MSAGGSGRLGVLLVASLVASVAATWWRRDRTARRRLDDLRPRARPPRVLRTVVGVAIARVGRATRRWSPSAAPPRPGSLDDRARGAMALALVAGAFLLHPMAAGLAALACIGPPALARRRERVRTREAVLDELPDVVELLHLAVSAGLNLRLALDVVVAHSRGRCADALSAVAQRVQRGERLVDALDHLDGLGPPARPLHDALVAAERHGTPVLEALGRVADEVRVRRRQRRDERARRLPVALIFPLVCCTLPALALVTVVPVVARPWLGAPP